MTLQFAAGARGERALKSPPPPFPAGGRKKKGNRRYFNFALGQDVFPLLGDRCGDLGPDFAFAAARPLLPSGEEREPVQG